MQKNKQGMLTKMDKIIVKNADPQKRKKRCYLCGIKKGETDHHSIPQRLNPVKNKTVPLCRPCHKLVEESIEFPKIKKQRIFDTCEKCQKHLQNKIKWLERKIEKQKFRLTQQKQIIEELRFLLKSKKKECLSDLYEILNNMEDDMKIEKTGEFGYKDEKAVVRAIRKYSLKIINRKIRKWEGLLKIK